MSSTNKTSLGLNQWVLSDQPVMNDFNSDNAILNAAIAALQQPIGTARIADGAVTTPKIANNSVTTPKIADDAIDTSKLMDDAVTSQKIGIHAVGTAEIADYAITTSKVLTRAITAEKLAAGYISTDYDGDLNELKTPGMYKVVPGISNQHRPPNVIYSSVLVMDAGSSVIIQLAAPASNDRLYIRGVVGGTTSQWTDWVEISALADGSITTAKLADGAVTAEKLADTYLPYHPAAGADASAFQDPGLYTDDPAQPDTDINVYSHPYLVLPVPRKGFTGTQDRTIQIRFNAEICLLEFRFGFSGDWQPLGAQCNTGDIYSLNGLTVPGVYETGTDVYPSPEPDYYGSYTIIVSGNQYETRQTWMCTQNGHRHTRTLQAGSSSWSDFVSLDANT